MNKATSTSASPLKHLPKWPAEIRSGRASASMFGSPSPRGDGGGTGVPPRSRSRESWRERCGGGGGLPFSADGTPEWGIFSACNAWSIASPACTATSKRHSSAAITRSVSSMTGTAGMWMVTPETWDAVVGMAEEAEEQSSICCFGSRRRQRRHRNSRDLVVSPASTARAVLHEVARSPTGLILFRACCEQSPLPRVPSNSSPGPPGAGVLPATMISQQQTYM